MPIKIFVVPEDENDRVKNTMDEIKSHLYKGSIIDYKYLYYQGSSLIIPHTQVFSLFQEEFHIIS